MQISISNIVKGTVIGSAFTAISRYFTRVTQAGAIYEKPLCVESGINSSPLLQQASMLILPSGYKGGTAYAELPSNGNGDLTWTRASDAWRTNADGLIQRVPWNLLLNTNTFSGWSLEGGALTSGFTAPDGTSTAYKYVQTTGGLYSGSSTAISGSKTASIWLKSVSGTSITCNLQDGGSGNNTVVTVTGDWQLFTATYTTSTSRPSLYVWGISNASGIYVWHPQLVEGTTAQTYLPTTDRLNFPRLSYMYGSCPAVLLEPQRTNLLVRSNEFSNVGVWVNTNLTVSDNSQSGIDGNTTAALITTTSTLNLLNQQVAVTAGTVYTFSFYVKRGTMTDLKYRVRNVTGASDIIPPTSYYSQTNSATFTRISVTVTAPVGCTAITFYPFSDTGSIGTAIITQAQVEVGSYATTIIPTTSAQATRIADSFSRNNIYTNGLITSSGGTWFVELRNNISYVRDGVARFGIGDTSAINLNSLHIGSLSSTTTRQQIYKTVAGSYFLLYTTLTDTVKIAIKWNGTSADVFVNGTKVVSATSFTTTNMEFLKDAGGLTAPTFIQQMALYPTPLSDTDCTTLTTL